MGEEGMGTMARPVSDSARGILSDYLVRLLMSYGGALDWAVEASSVLHLRIVNAALDSREGVLTWLEGRSESPKLISANPAVGRQIEMRLVRNGNGVASADAVPAVENLERSAEPWTAALESIMPEPANVEAAVDAIAPDTISSETDVRTYERAAPSVADGPAPHPAPAAPSQEMAVEVPALPEPATPRFVAAGVETLPDATSPELLAPSREIAAQPSPTLPEGAAWPPPLPALADYAQEPSRVADYERRREKRVRASLSLDLATRRVWTFIRAAQTNRGAIAPRW